MGRQRLPVIVGFGGVSGAGRSSGHHAFSRMVYSALPDSQRQRTLASLAALTLLPALITVLRPRFLARGLVATPTAAPRTQPALTPRRSGDLPLMT